MEWLLGAALLPILMCGLMCVGGMVLAALGVRGARRMGRGSCHDETADADPVVDRVR